MGYLILNSHILFSNPMIFTSSIGTMAVFYSLGEAINGAILRMDANLPGNYLKANYKAMESPCHYS